MDARIYVMRTDVFVSVRERLTHDTASLTGNRFVVSCDPHDSHVTAATHLEAYLVQARPWEFCDDCWQVGHSISVSTAIVSLCSTTVSGSTR